MSRKSQVSGSY